MAIDLIPRPSVSWASLLKWPLFLERTDGTVSPTRDAVAKKIIEIAKAGERQPGRLCDAAVQALREAIVSDPNPPPPPVSLPEPGRADFGPASNRSRCHLHADRRR